ncbi:Growth hormone-inducible transmembrane protein [Exaiptasia diaphana]|nr:Growth hormone-inducible transmembrane protein [Exaiptasia diaphana]
MLSFRHFTRCSTKSLRALSQNCKINASSRQTRRAFQTEARNGWRTWDAVEKAPGITAETVGRAVVGGAALGGVGALCYYGLGLSSNIGAIDRSFIWPQVVKDRIRSTYGYFAGSLAITAMSAYAVSRSRAVHTMMRSSPLLVVGGSMVAMIASSIVWHSALVGAVLAPMVLIGGPLVLRAAVVTGGVVGALSLTAACAPDGKFLTWGGPLALALGGVFMASLGTLFLPATSAVGAGLQAITTYGGLVVFGGFLLYDTQKIIRVAETHPTYGMKPYDPINATSPYITFQISLRNKQLLFITTRYYNDDVDSGDDGSVQTGVGIP